MYPNLEFIDRFRSSPQYKMSRNNSRDSCCDKCGQTDGPTDRRYEAKRCVGDSRENIKERSK